MTPEPDPLPWRPDATRRTARTWATLLFVWTVGLAVWVVYFTAIAYALIRLLFGSGEGDGG